MALCRGNFATGVAVKGEALLHEKGVLMSNEDLRHYIFPPVYREITSIFENPFAYAVRAVYLRG